MIVRNYNCFKQKIERTVIRDSFTTPEDLAYKIASSIGRFLISKRVKDELEKLPSKYSVSTPEGRDQIARRAARLGQVLDGTRILLVNDIPDEMSGVVKLLERLHCEVDIARSSEEALARLGGKSYELVISDMARDGVDDEGLRFLARMREQGVPVRTVFTVGQYRPERGVPAYAFGITNRVDELLNLVFDVVERERG
jgi:CheY-like chemotaxis protein